MICAVCGRDVDCYHYWPGVAGDHPVCFEGDCDADARLMAALGIGREDGWVTSGPWGSEPPPEGLLEWFNNAPRDFRERVDAEIAKLRGTPCAGSAGSGNGS